MLRETQVAGSPDSFFRPASIPEFARRWSVRGQSDDWDKPYLEAVRSHGKGGTACFGMRIMWSDMTSFLDRLDELIPEGNSDPARLHTALGVEQFIHLSRQDKVAQAVSMVIAAQTGLWHRNADGSERSRAKPAEEPHYDQMAIATELDLMEAEVRGWACWFHRHEIQPIAVTYEELASDPTRELERVLNELGVRSAELVGPGTAQLATARNKQWSERFRAEMGAT